MRYVLFALLLFVSEIAFSQAIEVSLSNYPFAGPYQATISAEGFSTGRERFDILGKDLDVGVLTGRPELPYKIWKQDHPAPAVIIIPGFASHYRSNNTLALANLFYRNGFHAISLANPMNFDFTRPALTGGIPGYTPSDAQDLHRALAAITKQLNEKYPGEIQGYVLSGYSSGGLYTLFISALESKLTASERIGFQGYLAINPPISPEYSLNQIDETYRLYKKWSDDEKKANYLNFATRMAALETSRDEKVQIEIIKSLPDHSLQVAIGATFRLKLAALFQVAYSDGYLNPLFEKGLLKDLRGTYHSYSRSAFYKAIEENFDFARYMNEAVVPYYRMKDSSVDMKTMTFKSSLYSIADELRTNSQIVVLHNRNDVYMHDAPRLKWLQETLGKKLVLFDKGGHVGNLYMPQVQERIVQSARAAFRMGEGPVLNSQLYYIRIP